MSDYSAITPDEIEVGKPVTVATQDKIKDNFDDHESRIQSVEAGSVVFPPIVLRVNGPYNNEIDVLQTTANFSFTITGVRILTDIAGTSGVLSIDLLRKRGGGSFTSILNTLPEVDYSAGDDALSTNTVLNGSYTDIETGDILRLDIVSTQINADGFLVRIDYIRA